MEDKKKSHFTGADFIKALDKAKEIMPNSYIPPYFLLDNIIGKYNYFSEQEKERR